MSELEEPQNPYELARWIIDFEFHDPKNRYMNSMKLAEIYANKIEAYISKRERLARLDELEKVPTYDLGTVGYVSLRSEKLNLGDK